MFLMSRTGFVRRSPGTSIDQRPRTCPAGPWCGPAGRCVPGRSSWVGGREGSLGAARSERGSNAGERREVLSQILIGDIPSSAGPTSWCGGTACVRQMPVDRRGLRSPQRPAAHSSNAGKGKDLADLWSRGTGDERRPALGPHGIAHAHPFGRVHAAQGERRRGLRHGLGDSPATRRRFTSVALDPEAGLRWPQLIRIGPEDSTGAREHRHSRRRPALGWGRPRWRSRSRSVCSAAPGRQRAAGPGPCIQRRSRCHQGRGHHWPFRSPFRAHAVIVFTYDWLLVNTAVREFPHTFLNVMDHPGPSRRARGDSTGITDRASFRLPRQESRSVKH